MGVLRGVREHEVHRFSRDLYHGTWIELEIILNNIVKVILDFFASRAFSYFC